MELFDKKFVHFMWDDSLEGKEGFFSDSIPYLIAYVEDDALEECTIGHKGYAKRNCMNDTYQFNNAQSGNSYLFFYHDPLYDVKLALKEGKQIQSRSKVYIDAEWIDDKYPSWDEQYVEYRVKTEMWTTCINDEGIVSVMPAREWNRHKGRQLIEGTEEKCRDFAIGNYCGKCAHSASCAHQWLVCDGKTFDTATRIDVWYCQGFKELKAVKKRRMTNRELAKWIMQGNGQAKYINLHTITSRGLMYDEGDDDKPCPDWLVIRGFDETEWHEPLIEEE